MTDADAMKQKIQSDYTTMFRSLRTIVPPGNHSWMTPRFSLTWWGGDVLMSTKGIGPSIYLRRTPQDDHHPTQLNVEVRLNWDEPGTPNRLDHVRCILWCDMGPRFNFTARSLLSDTALNLTAGDIDVLFLKIASELEPAFALYRRMTDAEARAA